MLQKLNLLNSCDNNPQVLVSKVQNTFLTSLAKFFIEFQASLKISLKAVDKGVFFIVVVDSRELTDEVVDPDSASILQQCSVVWQFEHDLDSICFMSLLQVSTDDLLRFLQALKRQGESMLIEISFSRLQPLMH